MGNNNSNMEILEKIAKEMLGMEDSNEIESVVYSFPYTVFIQ